MQICDRDKERIKKIDPDADINDVVSEFMFKMNVDEHQDSILNRRKNNCMICYFKKEGRAKLREITRELLTKRKVAQSTTTTAG